MTIRRGYSDSKLTQVLKPKLDEESLDNFLPKFLIKDMKHKDTSKKQKEENDLNENDKHRSFFEANEEEDLNEYLRHLSMKENIDTSNFNQGSNKMKVPRSKFSSNVDLKQYANDHKTRIYNQFQNNLQSQMQNYNSNNYNINYNLNQHINQNINPKSGQGRVPNNLEPQWNNQNFHSNYDNNAFLAQAHFNEQMSGSPNFQKIYSASPNDSGSLNFSLVEEYNNLNFISLRPTPKRTNSTTDALKRKPLEAKMKTSLFLSADKEEKGEDFADLQELMNSINVDLWEYAKSQKGSRNLQKLLNKIQPEGLDNILDKIKFNFPELMIDTYGNYFCQKLIQSCSSEQRMFILRHIMKDFTDISCNPSGTHALQSLIEIINMPGEEELVKESVKDNILRLSYNVNGTHVIQKVISCISEESREYINFTVLNNIHKLVFDSNGICVLKKFINSNRNLAMREILLNEITSNALEIVQNPFGNYVIQHILDEWGPEIARTIIDVIITTMISLSMQKFSSNVVEKCFDLVDMPTRKRMVKELFNASKISSLLKNKYGNFVLQKAISVMTRDEKKEIKEYLAKRVSFTSNKEKARLTSLIEII